MNESDIKYILELLNNAKDDNNWDIVDEAIEVLNEFLDDDELLDDE
jgi:hypothetical protein